MRRATLLLHFAHARAPLPRARAPRRWESKEAYEGWMNTHFRVRKPPPQPLQSAGSV